MRVTSSRDTVPLAQAWRSVTTASAALVAIGILVALAGPDGWAWLAVAGLALGATGQIVIALIAFRRTMRRKWPEVAPLSDDDWDD